MSWASRRRSTYIFGVVAFFVIVVGLPVAYQYYKSIPPVCAPGTERPPGVSGGPCPILDPSYLQPYGILWARSFKVRDGTYSAVAYIENPNQSAGVASVPYEFGLYDEDNILIAQRDGTMSIMPGAITPVLEARIDTGNRIVAHTYFQFTGPLTWERMTDTALPIQINDKELTNVGTVPTLSATAVNSSVADIVDPVFIAVIFDPAGNAFAASQTTLDRLDAGASSQIIFTWPAAFNIEPGQIDIIPVVPPTPAPAASSQ